MSFRMEEEKTFFLRCVIDGNAGMRKKKTFYGAFELTESDGGTTKHGNDRQCHFQAGD